MCHENPYSVLKEYSPRHYLVWVFVQINIIHSLKYYDPLQESVTSPAAAKSKYIHLYFSDTETW